MDSFHFNIPPFTPTASSSTDQGYRAFVLWLTSKNRNASVLMAEHAWNQMSESGKQGWANFAMHSQNQVNTQPQMYPQPQPQHDNPSSNQSSTFLRKMVSLPSAYAPLFCGFELYLYGRLIAFKKYCRSKRIAYSSNINQAYLNYIQQEWLLLSQTERLHYAQLAHGIIVRVICNFAKDYEYMGPNNV